jgi:hypothetical protein
MTTPQPKPWRLYKKPDGTRDKLYEPGYIGTPTDEEIEQLQEALYKDDALSYWWGFRPRMKRRPEAALRRVMMHGDPDNRSHNVSLVRQSSRAGKEDAGSLDSCVTKPVTPPSAPLGRKRKETWESTIVKLAREGQSLREIAAHLQGQGVDISYRSVSRRLAELTR